MFCVNRFTHHVIPRSLSWAGAFFSPTPACEVFVFLSVCVCVGCVGCVFGREKREGGRGGRKERIIVSCACVEIALVAGEGLIILT